MITIRNYKKVESLEEAWQLNKQRSNRILGGMLWIKMGSGNVQTAIDLSGLSLDKIEETEDGWRIGCMVTLRQLELHEGLNAYTDGAMRESLRHIVGVQFRNVATVGGSVFGRFGFSDVCTMLLAMDSYVELYKGGILSMKDFMASKYDRDILVSVLIKKTPGRYYYQSVRNSQTDFPVLACAAAAIPVENTDSFRIRLSVGARPGRARLFEEEELLFNLPITEEEAQILGERAAASIPTESNLRGSAAYRTHLIKVLAMRAALKLGGNSL